MLSTTAEAQNRGQRDGERAERGPRGDRGGGFRGRGGDSGRRGGGGFGMFRPGQDLMRAEYQRRVTRFELDRYLPVW